MKSIIHLHTATDDSKPRDAEDRTAEHRWRRLANPPPLVPVLIVVLLMALIGWQALASSSSHGWTAIIITSLVTVGAIVVRQQFIVRESRIQTSRLSQQIDRDPLTGLLNRRRIGQQIDFELAQAKTSGRALGLALIDIDNFKEVNDTHGHATGDQVLKSIAGILSRAC